jgi:hypothetical protein
MGRTIHLIADSTTKVEVLGLVKIRIDHFIARLFQRDLSRDELVQ